MASPWDRRPRAGPPVGGVLMMVAGRLSDGLSANQALGHGLYTLSLHMCNSKGQVLMRFPF